MTPWGDFYPCHQFVGEEEFLMGNVDEGITRPQIREEFKGCNVYTKDDCKDCFARFYCSGGCAANAYHFQKDVKGSYESLRAVMFIQRMTARTVLPDFTAAEAVQPTHIISRRM